jgi:transcriptional regulator with XRE-family HTH domain
VNSFGDRLKQLRKEKGLTQEQLAQVLKTERSTLSGYEQGIREPSFEMLCLMSDYHSVSIDYIVRGRSAINTNLPVINSVDDFEIQRLKAKISELRKLLIDTVSVLADKE